MKKWTLIIFLVHLTCLNSMDSRSPAEHLAWQIREEDQRELEEKRRQRREESRETRELQLEEEQFLSSSPLSLYRLALDAYVESSSFKEVVKKFIDYLNVPLEKKEEIVINDNPQAGIFEKAFEWLKQRTDPNFLHLLPKSYFMVEDLIPYIIKAQIDEQGNSLIHWALEKNYPPEEIAYLLSIYPNINLFNKEGLTVAQAIFIKAINENMLSTIDEQIAHLNLLIKTLNNPDHSPQALPHFKKPLFLFVLKRTLPDELQESLQDLREAVQLLDAIKAFIKSGDSKYKSEINLSGGNSIVNDKNEYSEDLVVDACRKYGLELENVRAQNPHTDNDEHDNEFHLFCLEKLLITSPIFPKRTIEYFTQDQNSFLHLNRFRELFKDIFLPSADADFPLSSVLSEQTMPTLSAEATAFLKETFQGRLDNLVFRYSLPEIKEFFNKYPSWKCNSSPINTVALHALVQNDRGAVVNFLLNTCGLNPNARDHFKRTPLHVGCLSQAADYLLLLPHLDVNAEDINDETALGMVTGAISYKELINNKSTHYFITRLIKKGASLFDNNNLLSSYLTFGYETHILGGSNKFAFLLPFYYYITLNPLALKEIQDNFSPYAKKVLFQVVKKTVEKANKERFFDQKILSTITQFIEKNEQKVHK